MNKIYFIDGDCGTFVELSRTGNNSYTFTSPGYPNGYKDNINCEWIFQAPIGDHIRLTFNDIRLEADSTCALDKVTIFHGKLKSGKGEYPQRLPTFSPLFNKWMENRTLFDLDNFILTNIK